MNTAAMNTATAEQQTVAHSERGSRKGFDLACARLAAFAAFLPNLDINIAQRWPKGGRRRADRGTTVFQVWWGLNDGLGCYAEVAVGDGGALEYREHLDGIRERPTGTQTLWDGDFLDAANRVCNSIHRSLLHAAIAASGGHH